MNLHSQNDFEIFCKNKLLDGFKLPELKDLYEISKPMTVNRGSILIREGEHGEELFFIMSGCFEIVKFYSKEDSELILNTICDGDVIGEVSYLDKGFRSATVRAKTECKIRVVSFDQLEQFINRSLEHSRLYVHLSKNISKRLRDTSNIALAALKKEVRENKIRVRMGIFLIYIVAGLCIFAYALSSLEHLLEIVPNSSYVALPLTLILGIGVLGMMKNSKLSWREFGISTKNWKQSTFEGFFFTIPILAIALGAKWILTMVLPEFAGRTLLEPFATIQDPAQQNWSYWIAFNMIYAFFMVPIQELLTRGALQGLLEDFLTGKYRILLSILMSNLIFSTIHVYLSLHLGFIVFLGGLFIGWIYSRTHNLIGSSIAHALLGIGFLTIFGTFAALKKF